MKYRVLIDYGSDGMRFWDDEGYETVNEAVQSALIANSVYPFKIVRVIDWEAKEIE